MPYILLFWHESELHTFKEWTQVSDSTSRMDTTFSAAAASNLPWRGWNLIWAIPPCNQEPLMSADTHNPWQEKKHAKNLTYLINSQKSCTYFYKHTTYLRHSGANTLIYTPVPNLTVTITGAQEIFIVWVKIQRHDWSLMASESPQRIAWLHPWVKNTFGFSDWTGDFSRTKICIDVATPKSNYTASNKEGKCWLWTYVVCIPHPHSLVKWWCCQPCWVWTEPNIRNQ